MSIENELIDQYCSIYWYEEGDDEIGIDGMISIKDLELILKYMKNNLKEK